MRRVLTLALALALAVGVRAELVRADVAARYAQGILGMNKAPVLQTPTRRVAARDAQSDPQYYVFNNPDGGWAVIAADDRVNPVIAYSDQGWFSMTDMPENLQWWMDGVAATIDAVRESGEQVAARAEWETMRSGTSQSGKVILETAIWDQDSPYNDQCPVVNGENKRSLTGCVATAMSIITRYNRWPAHGKGVIGGYTTTTAATYIPPYSIDDHEYDWDNMPLSNGTWGSWNQEQKNQVAQLMHDWGVAVRMDYTSDGSSAQSGMILGVLQNNMSYSDKSVLITRSSYNLDEWFSVIKNEIDAGRVVYYGGNSQSGGHAFVCDGYDTDGSKLRINWGWGSANNGFYTLDLAIPSMNLEFSSSQEAIIGIAPDTVDVELDNVVSLVCIEYNGSYGIEPMVPADITSGAEFRFQVGWMMNNSTSDVKADLRIRLEDKDGNKRQEGWALSMKIPASDGYIYSDETALTRLTVTPDLTDRFRLYIKNDEGLWEPMRGNYDILPDVEGIMCGVTPHPLITVPENCTAGQEIKLSLSIGFTPVKSVSWSVNGQELDSDMAVLVQGANAIRADVVYLDDTSGSLYRTVQVE